MADEPQRDGDLPPSGYLPPRENRPPPGFAEQSAMPPPGPIPYPADGVRGVRPSSHLGWAIASTLLCCIPAGIVSIVYAVKVNTLWDKGDRKGAASASKTAKAWAWFSFGLGIAGNIVILALDPSRYGL